VPQAVLGVPAAGLEVDLVDDRRIEELVEAARNPGRHWDSVHVVGVLGVLSPDVDLAGGRASGASDGLLDNLRRRERGGPLELVLLENLVPGAGIHRDGGAAHLDSLELERGRCQLDRQLDSGTSWSNLDLPGDGPEAD